MTLRGSIVSYAPSGLIVALLPATAIGARGSFEIDWQTIDGGGLMITTGGAFTLDGTIGQPDAGSFNQPMSGGMFELVGGFWGAAASAPAGVPAATLTAAVSRKNCDINLLPPIVSESRQGGITELRLTFDLAPGGPGSGPVSIEEDATCPGPPSYVPYSGASAMSADVAGNDLVLTFAPGLQNARTYRLTVGAEVTSIPNQSVEFSGLVGDVNSDGRVNAADRSAVVGVWTGSGFSCATDVNNSGSTNAADRSAIVGAWTGPQNCAP